MTRQEAIKRFQRMKKILSIPNSDAERTIEAIDMAIEALRQPINDDWERYSDFLWKEAYERGKQEALSAEADGEDLIIKGAKGIKDGLYNIKDGKLFQFKAKGGTVRTYPIVSSADAVQGWIPCSERLPEKHELVLVTVWNDVSVAWRNIYGGWESAEDTYEKGDVTAWMPLPKPYREENEE